MKQSAISNPQELEALLKRMRSLSAHASLRPDGGDRMLGDLFIRGLEAGTAIHLSGARRRDQIPPLGAKICLTVLLGEEVHVMRTQILEPILSEEGDTNFPPVLRVAWPSKCVLSQRRRDLRVATPDFPSLPATLVMDERRIEAKLLNLTETGLGLGLVEPVSLDIRSTASVETLLPGNLSFTATGEVRHMECLVGDALPYRIGFVIRTCGPEDRETLRIFVQARRTDRSQNLRQEINSRNGRKGHP